MQSQSTSFFLSLVTALAACGSSGDTNTGADATPSQGADAAQSEGLVNGVPASEYFGQFVWEVSDGALSGAAGFPVTESYDAYKIDAFLREDGTYQLFYGEGSGTVTSTGHSLNLDTTTFTRLEGEWSIDGTELVLAPYLRCQGLTLNGSEVLSCDLTQRVVTEAAVGYGGIAKLSVPSSPFDSEWSDYR